MTLSTWSGARIFRLAIGWILGLPLALFVVMQTWVIVEAKASVPHNDTVELYRVPVNVLGVLLVLLGPPLLLVVLWRIARWRGGKAHD